MTDKPVLLYGFQHLLHIYEPTDKIIHYQNE